MKRLNDKVSVRVSAFILCVVMFVGILVGGIATVISIDKAGMNFTLDEIFSNKDYLQSTDLQEEFKNQSSMVLTLISHFKSEEYILKENLLDESSGYLYDAIRKLYKDGYYDCGDKKVGANNLELSPCVITEVENKIEVYKPAIAIDGVQYAIPKEWYGNYTQESYEEAKNYAQEYVSYDADIDNEVIRNSFIEANKEQLIEIKNKLIKDELRRFKDLKWNLDSQEDISYFVTDGDNSYTNMNLAKTTDGAITMPKETEFTKAPAYMIYNNGKFLKNPKSIDINTTSWIRNIDQYIEDDLFHAYNDDLKIYLAFSKDYISKRQAIYQDTSGIVQLITLTIGFAVVCLILFIYLAVVTGRKDEEGKYKLYPTDKIWTEIQLAFVAAALGAGVGIGNIVYYDFPNFGSIINMELLVLIIACVLAAIVGLWFLLSCIRLLKARRFIKTSLFYKLWNITIHKWFSMLWCSLKDIYNGSSIMKKVVLITLAICLLSATVFLAPVVFLVIIVFAPKWVRKFEQVKNGVEEVKNGNLTYKIPVEGEGELDKLAQSINAISESSNVAVQNELKNQRMKTDLISNVSHDLKTPLTSMVTYIDLLKKEGLDSENAEEYLRILDEKTERLRHLTEDLFEAAKASSGAMPVNLEKVELLSLINQGLGEMDDKIQASGLNFIINVEKDKYYVMADGQLLWRVVENLLGNVLKYALENSRVYIDIKDVETKKGNVKGMITLEIKNISKNPLNISSDELMERFKRGDESRTTEGSGLGLAIAKDLVKLQKGWFEVFIDGDLFKARVMLDRYEEV